MADKIGPALAELLDLVAPALDPMPARRFVAAGTEVAWDECCEGQLWARVVEMVRPEQASLARPKLGSRPGEPCGDVFTIRVGIGVIRCAATFDSNGKPPKADTLSTEAFQVYVDQAAISQALQALGKAGLVQDRWEPLGPDGGCVGGEWTIIMNMSNW